MAVPKKLGTSFLDHKSQRLPLVRFFGFSGGVGGDGDGGVKGKPRSLASRMQLGFPQVGAGAADRVV